MTFKPGDRVVKITIPENGSETPAGGPYTVETVEEWSEYDRRSDHAFKEACHAVRVKEGQYGTTLENRGSIVVPVQWWDCSCEYCHLPPYEPMKQSSKTKRPVTA